jgi:CheY-like chemotaxis protein
MTHVLVVDDETHTRISLSFVLESAGYLVTDAPGGQEALDTILALRDSSHPIDLLLLDIEMPGFTGWELLDALKNQKISLPTVIITGTSDGQNLWNVSDKYFVECIIKPFTPELLMTSILRVIGKKEPSAANDEGSTLKVGMGGMRKGFESGPSQN